MLLSHHPEIQYASYTTGLPVFNVSEEEEHEEFNPNVVRSENHLGVLY